MPRRSILLLVTAALSASVPLAVAAPWKVALKVTVSGKGRVTSSPAGLLCPGTCRGQFASGARVRLVARASAGWVFGRWAGACAGTGKCSLKLTSAKSVRAVFVPVQPPPPPPGSSQDNPAPIGTAVAISIGDAPGGWTLKVNSVTPDASDQVMAADPDNIPPAPDNQDFMVSVTATYTGTGSVDAGALPDGLNLVDASSTPYQSAAQDGCGVLPDPDLVLVTTDLTVSSGATVTGNICWSVSTDDVSSLEMYNDQTAPVWFALH